MRIVVAVGCALACAGCMQETIRFKASPQQEAIVRDGRPAVISRQKNSLVMIRPAARSMAPGDRPVFVLGVNNLAKSPLELRIRNIAVTQIAGSAAVPIKVLSYEDLVEEERSRQVLATMLAGAAAGLNAVAAANAGYSHTTRISSRGGITHTASYSSSRARAAQRRAIRENNKLIETVLTQGQENLAMLERDVLKDNTLMPGEWYGGTLHLEPPAQSETGAGAKTYAIALTIGPDRHAFEVVQGARGDDL